LVFSTKLFLKKISLITLKTKKMAKKAEVKKAGVNRMTMISSRAKEIRLAKPSMKWTDAISAASKVLKKEGKL
jgi:hypothetical protein